MRIIAFAMAALAVSVWWDPLPVIAQFFALLALAVAFLSIREQMKRLDRTHKAALEIKDILREVREGRDGEP